MSKHTKGPWTVSIEEPRVVRAPSGDIITSGEDFENETCFVSNASRIVECVNALEGIENPAALQDFIREAYKLMLRCDRDEGVQSDGSNMSTQGIAMALGALGISSKIIEEIK